MKSLRRLTARKLPVAIAAGVLLVTFGHAAPARGQVPLDFPHAPLNSISCSSCHFVLGTDPDYLPPWTQHAPVNIDDTASNTLCWSCHNDIVAARVETHSSLTTDDGYGTWAIQCQTCHWPHQQMQFRTYGTEAFLHAGTSTALALGSLTDAAAAWDPGTYQGAVLIPNLGDDYANYKIIDNTADTLTVEGPIDLGRASVGNPYAIVHGKLVPDTVATPNSGAAPTRFFRTSGPNSFADGDLSRDGICEVCHTLTTYHRNDGSGTPGHNEGTACSDCHGHVNGFRGMGGGVHPAHLSAAMGPNIACDSGNWGCHGTYTPPTLADGQTLAGTAECTPCHSGDGAADAKLYWAAPGSSQSSPAPGSWAASEGDTGYCGSCHDSSPGIVSGATAPNVMGDQATYGFTVTGHGKPSGSYPRLAFQDAGATGNPAANRVCRDCHDPESPHIGSTDQRLKPGFENDQSNANCNNCHDPGGPATNPPDLYPDSAAYEGAPHGVYLCSQCHEVHGAVAGAHPGMVVASARPLCLGCHNDTPPNPPSAPSEPPADHNPISTAPCSNCHDPHNPAHGAGSTGSGCIECHGHDGGTAYDPDRSAPYTAGATASLGAGSFQSHSTHTETDSDDLRGPNIYCDDCHDIDNFPYFASGTDNDGDGRFDLTETDVCDPCHSPGGSYDGVDDPSVGAKSIWNSGAYTGNALAEGREKWCAGCHDEVPSEIQTVGAPNVVGDEAGAYTYGIGWGYYKTGHGLESAEMYPSKGGAETLPGRPVHCETCHDSGTIHVDSVARTYDDGDVVVDPSVYRAGYRLRLVSGQEPLRVPIPHGTANSADLYRLCLQAGCHSSGPFLYTGDMNTNLVAAAVNRHADHLNIVNFRFASDWSGAYNSQLTCVTCHNVHGSTRLAMVRDGKLVGREPGLQIWYHNDAVVTYSTGSPNPPIPADLPLAASTGTLWIPLSSVNLCSHCHANANLEPEYRTPYLDVSQGPTLVWTGEAGYESDGVSPDSGPAGGAFVFRVSYADPNNDAPSVVEVWLDANDDGTYQSGEKHAMGALDVGDVNYVNGKSYTKKLYPARAGDNILTYRFYASDGTAAATGDPTGDSSLAVANIAPTLAWTGEVRYQADGVNPDVGGDGASFLFRVDYADADNQAPSSIEVWVDENDNETYESGERYPLSAVDGADLIYSDGKRYARSLNLARAGDGILNYRFSASDGLAAASGAPVSGATLTVASTANGPPSLDFVAAACTTDGVKPSSGANGADFLFTVEYTDPDDQCPPSASDIQVWIDLNDASGYEAGEQFNMSEVDAGDTTCSDGKLYTLTRPLSLAGDNNLAYRFYASDGTAAAIGPATGDRTVAVVDAYRVRPAGGSGWYATIMAAVNASLGGNKTVLVYEGNYSEYINLWQGTYSNCTIRSVCGPDLTTITNPGAVIVFLQNVSGIVLDGFEITGGTIGVSGLSGSGTITNAKIHGNNNPGARGGGLKAGNSTAIFAVVDSEIYSNTANEGAAAALEAGFGHTFTRTAIRDNTTTAGGGAVFTQNGSVTFTDVALQNNTAAGAGGAVYSNGSDTTFIRSTIIGNTASGGDGGVVYNTNSNCDVVFENSVVAGNRANQAAITYVNAGTLNVINSTFAGNQATAGNGGAIINQNGTATVRNSILWDNSATGLGHIVYQNGGTTSISDTVLPDGGDGIFDNRPHFANSGAAHTLTLNGYLSATDPGFVDAPAGDYHLVATSQAVDTADPAYAPADDIDGEVRPQGLGDDIGADEVSAGQSVPTLAWTGEVGYGADGVDPDSAGSGSLFAFRVDYTDAENTPPALIQVWVDRDDNGVFGPTEKYAMAETDGGDTDFTDGKRYGRYLVLQTAGDGILRYRFYASDGHLDAAGPPITPRTLGIENNAPSLAWTGEANYVNDGVDPNSAVGGSTFTFRVDYFDADNSAPSAIQVWVNRNDNGTYEAGERYDLTGVDGGDTTYSDGKRYARSLTVGHAGDGTLSYRFYATDGADVATGLPTAGASLTVTNNVPSLAWTGEAGYTTDGVDPDSDNAGSTFNFRVDYTDPDDILPSAIEVWVDANDNSTYEAGERFALTETDSGDTSTADGKRYSTGRILTYAGDGVFSYRFYASDGSADATGTPASGGTVTVISAVNTPPTLAWSAADCRTEGVRPATGADGTDFEFLVNYTDADNQCAATIQVWVDEDDSGAYAPGEQYDLNQVDSGDTVCSDGKLYSLTRTLSTAGDGQLIYRFYASDGVDPASGPPTSDATLRVYAGAVVRPAGTGLPADYTSIITAANAVAGTILIYPNDDFSAVTYSENITLYDKDGRTLVSACGPNQTIISSPSPTSATLTAQDSADLVIDGFSITGATSNYGINVNRVDATVLTIRNSKVYGNSHGIYVNDGDDVPVEIDNVEIYGNSARGITLVNFDDDANITNCVIHSHTGTSQNGAAVALNNGNTVTITNSVLRDNTTTGGGGAVFANAAGANLTIVNSNIYGNQAANGGAINMAIGASATISKTTIRDNMATGQGGAFYTNAAGFKATNSIIAGNQAGTNGGAIATNSGPTIEIINSTLADNQGANGGAFYMCAAGSNTIRNSIFWNNTSTSGNGANIYKTCGGGNIGTISDSDMTTSSPSIYGATFTDGGGNISPAQDPLFVDAAGDDYHLQGGSPVIDQANPSYAPDDDIDGDCRSDGNCAAGPETTPDMGADEVVP